MREHGASRGIVVNPMTREEVEEKSRARMPRGINKIWNLEQVTNMRKLTYI